MNTAPTAPHARQFKRLSARLEAQIEPHPDHVEQFRLSFSDAQTDLAVSDVSQGGLGLITGVMLPKNLRLTVRILSSQATGGASFTLRTITRRCVLMDHKPTYQVGLQFLDPCGAAEHALVKAVAMNAAEKVEPVGAGSHGA